MVSPISMATHQSIGFLVRSDMVQHDLMQVMLRQIGVEINAMQLAANMRNATSNAAMQRPEVALPASPDTRSQPVQAVNLVHQINHAMVLQEAARQFGLPSYCTDQYGNPLYEKRQRQSSDQSHNQDHQFEQMADAEDPLDDTDLAVFTAIDQMFPELQQAGYCAGMLVGVIHVNNALPGLWQHESVVLLIPLGGELGVSNSVFACLLTDRFDPIGLKGVITDNPGSPVNPLPALSLLQGYSGGVVWRVSFECERNIVPGKAFLLGDCDTAMARQLWFAFD